ncbi:MAG: folylpolyglutamate synthase/dihydrofolate synthase family protein [Bacteroidota bacterium]
MKNRQYEETLAQLYQMLPMYQREGKKAMKKGLDNILDLCWEMGLPQWKFNSIHVAGTNGKGSVSAMIASVLQEAGFKVGMYTSPHLLEFTERIRVNGKEIPQEDVVEFVDAYSSVIHRIEPSFFELTVAMAFEYFAEQEVDFAVVEVGLGGRLDSTNIIRPEVSVITNISWDHMDILGDTLPQIALEKAGIIKPYTPVVIGERKDETAPVFIGKAHALQAEALFADQIFEIQVTALALDQVDATVLHIPSQASMNIKMDLGGKYQVENLRTALSALDVLRNDIWEISQEAIVNGLQKVKRNTGFRGRMERLQDKPLVICDTAHNEAGLESVIQYLIKQDYGQLHIVFGTVSDKDHQVILKLLPKEAHYYFVKPQVPRGLNELTLRLRAEVFDLHGNNYKDVATGIETALNQAKTNDCIFIGGSTFVVAEALMYWQSMTDTSPLPL